MDERSVEPREASPDRIHTRTQFTAELRLLRDRAGRTVRDLSTRIGRHPHSTLGDWFAGRSVPSTSSRALLVRVLEECGVTEKDDIERWLEAWRRVQRAPGPRSGSAPYRGLASFQPADAEWFFGREALSEQVASQIMTLHAGGGGLQVVVGASGSGKSSLLRAGVVPALGALAAPGRPAWPVALLTPGAEPLEQLAAALAVGTGVSPAELAEIIKADPAAGMVEQISKFTAGATRPAQPDGRPPADLADRLLIVVDQFEELFTMCLDEQDRRAFIAALVAAAHSPAERGDPDSGPPVATVVLLGLRADFYPQALRYAEIASVLQNAQFVVGPLNEEDLRRAIVEPASKANIQIDEGLVELLIREAAPGAGPAGAAQSETGALPLLSHALLATWQRAERGRMTTMGYLSTGGIKGAVAETAEEVYGDLTDAQKIVARRVFLRLVNLGEDTADTRRKVVRNELEGISNTDEAALDDVIEHFVGARLLTMDADTIEISHEALLTAWPRLRGWIDSDRDGLRRHRQLADDARQWRELGREPGSLYRGGKLDGVRDWTDGRAAKGDLNPLEVDFLTASVAAEQTERAVARRQTLRLKRMVAALTVLALSTAGLAGYSFWKRDTANKDRDLAMSRQVAVTANRLRATDPALAARLSLAAYQIAPTMEARSSLLDATGTPPVTRIVRPSKGAQNVILSPDGRTMFAAGTGPSDTAILTWDLSDPRRPRAIGQPLADHTMPVFGLAVSPDGRLLATGGRDQKVRLWNIADPGRPVALGVMPAGPSGTVYSLAFTPDSRTLAAGSSDKTVKLWDVTDPVRVSVLRSLPPATGFVQSVAFSPDGSVLVTGDASGYLSVWDAREVRNIRLAGRQQTGPDQINSLKFAPQGKVLAVGGTKGLFQLWNLTKPEAATRMASQIQVPENWVNAVAFSPDGRLLAIGSSDNVAQVWEVATGRLVSSLPHAEPVSSVAFASGDRSLLTGGSDGVARLWSIPGPVITGATATVASTVFGPHGSLATFGGQAFLVDVSQPRAPVALAPGLVSPLSNEPVTGAGALSPDGQILAAGTTGTSVLLWDTTDPARPKPLGPALTGPSAIVESLAFTPDSRILAAGGDDGLVHLWDLSDRHRPTALPDAPGAGSNYIYQVAISPDGRTLVGVTADGVIRVWDMSNPRQLRALPSVKGSVDLLFSAAFSLDGKILATGSADGTVRLWDITHPSALTPIGEPLSGPDGTVAAVAFGPDGHTLAATTRSGQVWFWDVAKPGQPTTIAILSASDVAIWSVGFSPDGHTVATGGSDRTVRLWEIDPVRAIDLICSAGGDSVSSDEWGKYLPGVPYRPGC